MISWFIWLAALVGISVGANAQGADLDRNKNAPDPKSGPLLGEDQGGDTAIITAARAPAWVAESSNPKAPETSATQHEPQAAASALAGATLDGPAALDRARLDYLIQLESRLRAQENELQRQAQVLAEQQAALVRQQEEINAQYRHIAGELGAQWMVAPPPQARMAVAPDAAQFRAAARSDLVWGAASPSRAPGAGFGAAGVAQALGQPQWALGNPDPSSAPSGAVGWRAGGEFVQVNAQQGAPAPQVGGGGGGGPLEPGGDRPQSQRTIDQSLVDLGSVLLPRGSLQLESGYQLDRVSNDRVNISGFSVFNAIVIGTIRVDQVAREIHSVSAAARYGLMDRVQLEMRVPFVYRRDRETLSLGTGDARERIYDGDGLGDSELSLSWQPLANKGWLPATIVRAKVRAPTGISVFDVERQKNKDGFLEIVESPRGSGFWGFGLNSTMVWQQDPVVLFTGVGYTVNRERTYAPFGAIDPGDTLELSAGFNLALNERTSFNASFINQRTFRSFQNKTPIAGSTSYDARLALGFSIGITDTTSLSFGAQSGLTQESPDFVVSLATPLTVKNVNRRLPRWLSFWKRQDRGQS
jgi:uncharacterized coiled-coil protein SlyX